MQEIVRQLGELFLQAVPTVLIILLFYFILRAIFFKPLLAVMAERDARTVGAQKAAEAAQAAAIEKIKQYQDALKQARREIEATVAQLSAEIARRILQSPRRPGGSAREAR
jgi:F0F1-type ATP synthase membrane subunit b/b'